MKKKIYYAERYFRGHRYMRVKADAIELIHGTDFLFGKTWLRGKLSTHAHVVNRLIDDFLKDGIIEAMDASTGILYRRAR